MNTHQFKTFIHDNTWLALGLSTAGIPLVEPFFSRVYSTHELTRADGSKMTTDQATAQNNLGRIQYYFDRAEGLDECRQAYYDTLRDVRAGITPQGLDYIPPKDICRLAALFSANRASLFEAAKMMRPSVSSKRPDGSFVLIGADASLSTIKALS